MPSENNSFGGIMNKKVVFITGSSGSMGSQVLKYVMETKKFKGLCAGCAGRIESYYDDISVLSNDDGY